MAAEPQNQREQEDLGMVERGPGALTVERKDKTNSSQMYGIIFI